MLNTFALAPNQARIKKSSGVLGLASYLQRFDLIFFLSMFLVLEIGCSPPEENGISPESTSFVTMASTYQPVTVRVNGDIFNYTHQGAVLDTVKNRVLVPLNETLSRCGFNVTWNDQTEEATCNDGGTTILVFKKNSTTVKRMQKTWSGTWDGTYEPLGAAPTIINDRMMIPIHALSDYTSSISAFWDNYTKTVNVHYWDENYVGLSWLGKGGKGFYNFQKYVPGENNPYYNPDKKTIIYIHGYQFKGVWRKNLPNLLLARRNIFEWTQNYWIDRGWNVGIFHWTNYADEVMVWDAESKIWDAAYGDQKMQWINSKGHYIRSNMDKKTVGTHLYETYLSALNNQNPNREVRLVAHSLGAQLALLISRRVIGSYGPHSKYSPSRITILDPAAGTEPETFLQYYNKAYNGHSDPCSTAEISAAFGKYLADKGVAIEFYKTSYLMDINPLCDENRPLQKIVCFTELNPWYTNNPLEKHTMPIATYFWSLAFQPSKDNFGGITPHPGASNQRIREMMGPAYKWIQSGGMNTETPADDRFSRDYY